MLAIKLLAEGLRFGSLMYLVCVNYDGFDGSDTIFPDMITVTEKDRKVH